MVDNTLKSELFFELVYSLSGLSGETDILRKGLPMYLRKLSCFAACVMKKDGDHYAERAVLPAAFRTTTLWRELLDEALYKEQNDAKYCCEIQRKEGYFYLYRMAEYGVLILGRKNPLDHVITRELAPIATFLGKSLKQTVDQELRLQAEQLIREREELNRLIMDSAMDAITIVDSQGVVQYWNPAAEEIFGWTAPEVVGQRTLDAIIPHIGPLHTTQPDPMLNRLLEIPALHKFGHEFPIELSVISLNQNNNSYFCGFIKDISQRKNKDEIIRQQIELQDLLIKISSSLINIDLNKVEAVIQSSLEEIGRFVGADRAYVFDYDFSDFTTSTTHEWCDGGISSEKDNLQKVPLIYIPQWLEQHQKSEPFYIPDIRGLPYDGPNGLRATLEAQGIQSLISIPMRSHDDLIGFVGFDSVRKRHLYTDKEKKLLFLFAQMLINVFERRQREKLLTTQEEKYRNIIANMNLGLLEVDKEETILFANQRFCDISGYSFEELIGQKSTIFLMYPAHEHMLRQKENLREQGISDNYELAAKNKAGEPRWWFVSGAPNYNDKGDRTGSIGIHLDITQQKRLEQDLEIAKNKAEEASQAKEAFLANMSHEIRTPLNAIIGMIRELGREDLTPKQQLYLSHSETAARHLLNIINNVLDISKIEAGEFDLDIREFSLSSVISNVKSILQTRAAEKGLHMNVLVSPDIAPCHLGDGTRIRQILINLIGNAIKFTEKGRVSLLAEVVSEDAHSQMLKFTITDTGVGMSETVMNTLFSKFSQEEDKSTRRFEGTGLGMAITQEMIQLMKGRIQVSSQKNEGTAIEVTLRLELGDPSRLYAAAEAQRPGSLRGIKVLLVEDNDMNRYIACQSLSHFDCDVIEAVNGKDAIEKLTENPVDIVLMDVQMPVMDGVEATRYIREHISRSLPIIALTVNAFKKDIDHYLASGMNDYVTKPFEENILFNAIANHAPSSSLRAADSAHAPKAPLYNLTKLRDISRGNTDFLYKMIGIFAEQTPATLHDMQTALAAAQWEKLSKLAHRIKPGIDNMGITALTTVIRDIEARAKAASPDAQRLADMLQSTHQIVQQVVTQLRADLPEAFEA